LKVRDLAEAQNIYMKILDIDQKDLYTLQSLLNFVILNEQTFKLLI